MLLLKNSDQPLRPGAQAAGWNSTTEPTPAGKHHVCKKAPATPYSGISLAAIDHKETTLLINRLRLKSS